MASDLFGAFSNEYLQVRVENEEQWDRFLDILEQEEDMHPGFYRQEYRYNRCFYIYYDCDIDEVHVRGYPDTDCPVCSFEDMVDFRWPHLSENVPMDINIGQLF